MNNWAALAEALTQLNTFQHVNWAGTPFADPNVKLADIRPVICAKGPTNNATELVRAGLAPYLRSVLVTGVLIEWLRSCEGGRDVSVDLAENINTINETLAVEILTRSS